MCSLHSSAASSTDGESSDESAALRDSDVDLWARLPRKFRADCGLPGGLLPGDEILGFLADSREDMGNIAAGFCTQGSTSHTRAVHILWELRNRALPRAQTLNNRRGRVDPAW